VDEGSQLGYLNAMPKVDSESQQVAVGSRYPAPFDEPCKTRVNARISHGSGVTQFGVVLTRLPPGAWSSQRHWHAHEDEFVHVLSGQVVLIEDAGETLLGPGDSAGFPAGTRNGHHFVNRSPEEVVLFVVGSRDDRDWGEYPDIDMKFLPERYSGKGGFAHKDGTPY
jgi:uncharacterized cupin superfamily protein